MILEAPPAAAMTYVKESIGLDPSVYGGGGSPSSGDFPEDFPSWSRERDALVSATIDDDGSGWGYSSSRGGGGPSTGRDGEPDSETLGRLGSVAEGKKREEKGGGRENVELDEEASDDGECGGGAV